MFFCTRYVEVWRILGIGYVGVLRVRDVMKPVLVSILSYLYDYVLCCRSTADSSRGCLWLYTAKAVEAVMIPRGRVGSFAERFRRMPMWNARMLLFYRALFITRLWVEIVSFLDVCCCCCSINAVVFAFLLLLSCHRRYGILVNRSPPKEEDDMRAAEVLQGLKGVGGPSG